MAVTEHDEITYLKEIAADQENTRVSHVANENTYPLTAGKKYHLFIIYSMEDEEDVRNIVLDIEEKFSLCCMLHERDFEPGVSISQNCQDKIAESEKVLVFLSPHYFKSYHCQEEMKIAKVRSHDVKRNDFIIPVILRPIEDPLPPEFRYHTYIDAKKAENLTRKIYDAFLYDEEAKEKEDLKNRNGYRLLEQKAVKMFSENYSGMTWTFPHINDTAQDSKDKEVQTLYNLCAEKLNESRLLRWHGLLLFGGRSCCFAFTVALAFFLLFLGTYCSCLIYYQTDRLGRISAFLNLGAEFLCPVFWIVCPILFTVYRRKQLKTADKEVWLCNNMMKQSKCLALLRGSLFAIDTNCLEIVIIRYDRKKCINYIVSVLQGKYPTSNTENLQEIAMTFVQNTLFGSRKQLLCWDTLKDVDVNHHNTWKSKQCICDMVVPFLDDPSLEQVTILQISIDCEELMYG